VTAVSGLTDKIQAGHRQPAGPRFCLSARDIGMTVNPSMTASRPATASTSVTTTPAPIPRARIASPRPHQPQPETTKQLPAIRRLVARMMPSIVLWPV